MTDDKIKHISEKRREKSGNPIKDAIRQAKQHIRNINADDLEEPEAFASGDMKKFLDSPEECEKDEDDEQKDDK